MKNLKYLFFGVVFFFVFSFSIQAKNIGITYDANEHFNYFYEQKTNSPFYHFLTEYGSDLPQYLATYEDNNFTREDNRGLKYLFIFYADDLEYNFDVPSDAKYAIMVSNGYTSNDSINFKIDGTLYYYQINSSNGLGFLKSSMYNIYFFDESANYISHLYRPVPFNDLELYFNIANNTGEEASAEFSYFISMFYLGDPLTADTDASKYDMVVSEVILDGKKYLIDGNENYSSFLAALRQLFSFGNLPSMDVVDTHLQFFKINKVFSEEQDLLSLWMMVAYFDEPQYPFSDDYVSVKLSDRGVYLVPKTTSLEFDEDIYYYSYTSDANIRALIYDISTDDVSLLNDNYYIFSPEQRKYGRFGFLDSLSSDETHSASDYMFYINTEVNKFDVYIYYNRNYYDCYDEANVGLTDFKFNNVNTGNDVTINFSKSTG